jgi:hypothetical protein
MDGESPLMHIYTLYGECGNMERRTQPRHTQECVTLKHKGSERERTFSDLNWEKLAPPSKVQKPLAHTHTFESPVLCSLTTSSLIAIAQNTHIMASEPAAHSPQPFVTRAPRRLSALSLVGRQVHPNIIPSTHIVLPFWLLGKTAAAHERIPPKLILGKHFEEKSYLRCIRGSKLVDHKHVLYDQKTSRQRR